MEIENMALKKFTNIDKEDFVCSFGSHTENEKDEFGNEKRNKKGRPSLVAIPNFETIKAGETVIFVESKAKLFCKHLVDKILLREGASDWTVPTLRKPLEDAILDQDKKSEEVVDVEVEEKGEIENAPGKPAKHPKIKVSKKLKV